MIRSLILVLCILFLYPGCANKKEMFWVIYRYEVPDKFVPSFKTHYKDLYNNFKKKGILSDIPMLAIDSLISADSDQNWTHELVYFQFLTETNGKLNCNDINAWVENNTVTNGFPKAIKQREKVYGRKLYGCPAMLAPYALTYKVKSADANIYRDALKEFNNQFCAENGPLLKFGMLSHQIYLDEKDASTHAWGINNTSQYEIEQSMVQILEGSAHIEFRNKVKRFAKTNQEYISKRVWYSGI